MRGKLFLKEVSISKYVVSEQVPDIQVLLTLGFWTDSQNTGCLFQGRMAPNSAM